MINVPNILAYKLSLKLKKKAYTCLTLIALKQNHILLT